MDRALSELRDQRDRAAHDALALRGWSCSRASVAWAVEAMLANSQQATAALGWLLRQIEGLPDAPEKEEAMEKVLDLSFAIAALARAEATQGSVVPFPPPAASAAEGQPKPPLHPGAVVRTAPSMGGERESAPHPG
jgi:hypothetical protein